MVVAFHGRDPISLRERLWQAKFEVLIAEDDVNTHDEWRESLKAWGFRGEIAEDGVRALELISTFDPQILLSDLRMPRKGVIFSSDATSATWGSICRLS